MWDAGMRFGPPGVKTLIYFIDDMNMPSVDKYDTQTAIELVRQAVDYNGWYDKAKVVQKVSMASQYFWSTWRPLQLVCLGLRKGRFTLAKGFHQHF